MQLKDFSLSEETPSRCTELAGSLNSQSNVRNALNLDVPLSDQLVLIEKVSF